MIKNLIFSFIEKIIKRPKLVIIVAVLIGLSPLFINALKKL
jgi:hypothetical protein